MRNVQSIIWTLLQGITTTSAVSANIREQFHHKNQSNSKSAPAARDIPQEARHVADYSCVSTFPAKGSCSPAAAAALVSCAVLLLLRQAVLLWLVLVPEGSTQANNGSAANITRTPNAAIVDEPNSMSLLLQVAADYYFYNMGAIPFVSCETASAIRGH